VKDNLCKLIKEILKCKFISIKYLSRYKKCMEYMCEHLVGA